MLGSCANRCQFFETREHRKLLRVAFEREAEKLGVEVAVAQKIEQNKVGREQGVSKQLER